MNIEFLEALEEMARERGIDREAAYEAMEKGIAPPTSRSSGVPSRRW
jgi:hypothetical protein